MPVVEGIIFTYYCANFHINFAFSLYFKKNVCYNIIEWTRNFLFPIIHKIPRPCKRIFKNYKIRLFCIPLWSIISEK